ncbi:MAG TPA: hypothetical protein VKA09_01885 [Nitrososphaeraceae archaeon]|nr:hypothetical protein [Nitrososphaeraceae archaeon]
MRTTRDISDFHTKIMQYGQFFPSSLAAEEGFLMRRILLIIGDDIDKSRELNIINVQTNLLHSLRLEYSGYVQGITPSS